MENHTPVKVKRQIATPVYDSQSELAVGMSVVWAEYENAEKQLKRCRRVIVANAALFNAEKRLRDRLAEFNDNIPNY
jgi:DNA-binding IclR family transcriptional regulator